MSIETRQTTKLAIVNLLYAEAELADCDASARELDRAYRHVREALALLNQMEPAFFDDLEKPDDNLVA
jgi:hypothetical protein